MRRDDSVLENQSNKIVLACASDRNYVMPLSVMLFSAVSHLESGSDIDVYILSLGITPELKDRIRKTVVADSLTIHIEFIDVATEQLGGLPVIDHLTVAAYLRLLLPDLLPETCKRVLYLDSDVLVRKTLRPLWNESIGDNHLLAVTDIGYPVLGDSVPNWQELGLPPNAELFNSGVMLFNFDQWREHQTSGTALEYARKYKSIVKHDQDVLNAVCYNYRGPLDLTWNVCASYDAIHHFANERADELWSDPSIQHFSGRWKPWVPGHRPHLGREWFSYLRRSKWFTTPQYLAWHFNFLVKHYPTAFYRKFFART
jgi:lipopolysaccharide biosynthesis glycosyltransferase